MKKIKDRRLVGLVIVVSAAALWCINYLRNGSNLWWGVLLSLLCAIPFFQEPAKLPMEGDHSQKSQGKYLNAKLVILVLATIGLALLAAHIGRK
jgi:hypothetical protein